MPAQSYYRLWRHRVKTVYRIGLVRLVVLYSLQPPAGLRLHSRRGDGGPPSFEKLLQQETPDSTGYSKHFKSEILVIVRVWRLEPLPSPARVRTPFH